MVAGKSGGKEGGLLSSENIIIALLAMLIFITSFYFFSTQLREHDVRGLKVLSRGDPLTEMTSILSGSKTTIKAFAYPGEDARNSYVALLTAEIAGAFSASGRNVSTYAYVPEEVNSTQRYIGCDESTDFCSNEKIVVQLDPCNCMRISDGKIYVLYEEEKIKQPSLRTQLRGVFGGVLRQK
ncbi:MAG: hypothetical protein AABX01_08200 [Candidatus Micrarchaeota archaeon]